MHRRIKVSPFSHWPTAQRPRRDTPLGWRFFCLGLPSIPTPQLSEVTPPVTQPRLFPVALSALIVADWLNGENRNGGAGGGKNGGKKEMEGEDLGKRDGRSGKRPLFFSLR